MSGNPASSGTTDYPKSIKKHFVAVQPSQNAWSAERRMLKPSNDQT